WFCGCRNRREEEGGCEVLKVEKFTHSRTRVKHLFVVEQTERRGQRVLLV
ncbi:AAEL012127-PA, partial [Aedes aegypti]